MGAGLGSPELRTRLGSSSWCSLSIGGTGWGLPLACGVVSWQRGLGGLGDPGWAARGGALGHHQQATATRLQVVVGGAGRGLGLPCGCGR